MPIRIQCQCGKSLNVRDDLAGKKIKCPGCGNALVVGGGGAAAAAPARPAPRPPAQPAAPSGRMDDLFSEEGFSEQVAAVCPACRQEMEAGAILCVKCGYNTQTGERYEAHKTAGVDVDHGTLALEKAEQDMKADTKMQKDMISGAGMPWWGLALVLFVLGSGLTIAVLAVNASRRVDENFAFNPLALFFFLAGTGFQLVGMGASILIIVHAFKEDVIKGVLCLFVPFYMLFYVITHWQETWQFFAAAIVMGGISGAFFAGVAIQGGI